MFLFLPATRPQNWMFFHREISLNVCDKSLKAKWGFARRICVRAFCFFPSSPPNARLPVRLFREWKQMPRNMYLIHSSGKKRAVCLFWMNIIWWFIAEKKKAAFCAGLTHRMANIQREKREAVYSEDCASWFSSSGPFALMDQPDMPLNHTRHRKKTEAMGESHCCIFSCQGQPSNHKKVLMISTCFQCKNHLFLHTS